MSHDISDKPAWQRNRADADPNEGGFFARLKSPMVFLPLLVLIAAPTAALILWPEPEPRTERVLVSIQSTPQNATVYVDGKKLNSLTNTQVAALPGRYTVRMEMEGRRPVEKTLVVESAKSKQTFLVKLEPTPVRPPQTKTYPITIISDPASADVQIFENDKQVASGKSPATFKLAPGKYEVKAEAPGRIPASNILTVTDKKETHTLKITLAPKQPTFQLLTIQTDPPGATVIIGKETQPKKSGNDFKLPVGTHIITLQLDEYKPITEKVEIRADKKPAPLIAKFTPDLRPLFIKSDPKGAVVFLDGIKQKEKTPCTLMVKPGLHLVKLEYEGRTVSGKVEVGKNPEKPDTYTASLPSAPRRLALLIGVHHYANELPDFLYAEADVMKTARILKIGGFDQVEVLMQSLGKNDAARRPTAKNILAELEQLAQECNPQDQVFIAMIGHQIRRNPNGDTELHFAPSDTVWSDRNSFLPMREIYQKLQQCKAEMKIVLIDGWRYFAGNPVPYKGEAKHPRPNALDVPKGIAVFTSCCGGRFGFVHPDDRYGMFFYYVSRGLIGFADADNDERVTWKELADYVPAKVRAESQKAYASKPTPELVGNLSAPDRVITETKPFAEYRRALTLISKENYLEAKKALDTAVAANKDLIELYLKRVDVYYKLTDKKTSYLEQAVADCETVLKKEPFNAKAHAMLSGIYFRQGILRLALEHVNHALALEPQSASDYVLRGNILLDQASAAKAANNFTKAIELNHGLTDAYQLRGKAYLRQDECELAIQDFDRVLTNCPSADTFFWRGQAYEKLKERSKAIDDYGRSISADKKYYPPYSARGRLHALAGDFQKASKDFEAAVEIQPTSEKALLNLGIVYAQMKQYKMAIPVLERAIQAAPTWAAPYENLIAVYRADKQPKEAERIRKLAATREVKLKGK